ncbi:ABC transporter permease subunit [Microbacterium sp. LWO13-1.2]|uniref:ABC transporter permease subunit n=1 Tax=Microbacterium sp. LWO13-1.2 TaxID=3135262 RepID=UPI003139C514
MSKPLPVFRRALRESWRGLLGWTVGIAAILFLYLPLFPSIGGNGEMTQIIESLPPELVNALGYNQIGTGAGYTQATFYGLIGFLLVTIAAVSWGADAIGGAEESGRLELDLAHGVGRAAFAMQAASAMLIRVVWLGVFAAIIIFALNGSASLDIEPWRIVDETVVFVGVTMLSGTVSLFVGALTGRRSRGVAAGAGIAVVGYAFNAISNQAPDAEWLRILSPYSWAFHQPPLVEGLAPAGCIALWGATAILIAGSVWALRRRDIVG